MHSIPLSTRMLRGAVAARRHRTISAAAAAAAADAAVVAPQAHPVVYHPDFRLSPLPEGHRFPMPKVRRSARACRCPGERASNGRTTPLARAQLKAPPLHHPPCTPCTPAHCPQDHLLYLRLQELGLAGRTFTPTPPDIETLCLVGACLGGSRARAPAHHSQAAGLLTPAQPIQQQARPPPQQRASPIARTRRRPASEPASEPSASAHPLTHSACPPQMLCAQAHDEAYVRSFLDGSIDAAAMRRIGLPWSETLVRRTLIGTGSAVLAARLALQLGVAVMCNGGTHHAHRGFGAGARVQRG